MVLLVVWGDGDEVVVVRRWSGGVCVVMSMDFAVVIRMLYALASSATLLVHDAIM